MTIADPPDPAVAQPSAISTPVVATPLATTVSALTGTTPVLVPRAILVLLGAAAAVVVVAGMRAASDLVAPIVLALVLTIAVVPLLGWARRHGWPSWAGVLLALGAVYAIVLFLVVGISMSVVELVQLVPQYAPSADQLKADAQQLLTDLGLPATGTGTALDQLDLGTLAGVLTGILEGVLGTFGNLFFLVTLLFFFGAEAAGFPARVAAVGVGRPSLADALVQYVSGVQHYLVVTTVFGFIVAVLDTAALWLLAIPLPLLWGLLAFLTNFIPNIGFVIGVIPPALIALLDKGWGSMLAVIAVYSVLNVTIQTFIQPRFVGESVGLSTMVAFVSLAVWAFVLGPIGALLAVPMTLLVRALLIDPDPRATWSLAFIATNPPTPAAAAADGAPADGAPSPPPDEPPPPSPNGPATPEVKGKFTPAG